jgi:hypothetical protein
MEDSAAAEKDCDLKSSLVAAEEPSRFPDVGCCSRTIPPPVNAGCFISSAKIRVNKSFQAFSPNCRVHR